MAQENDAVIAEVMNLPEVEPANSPAAAPGPDIPALRERLAILVSTGKCKQSAWISLVRPFEDKDVMKQYKRYETYIGAKTTETLIEGFLSLGTKVLGLAVKIKDCGALQNELKNDYIIRKELSALSGGLALRCGPSARCGQRVLITAKHVDFSSEEPQHPSRDSDGYPLAGVDEVPTAQ